MRTLYLIRHGQPLTDQRRTCGYAQDVPLSPEGRRQAEALALWARDKEIQAVYASPLLRCRQTADILAREYTPVYLEDDLREVDTGAWTGLTFEEIKARWPAEYERRGRELGTFPPPGGESFHQAGARMERTITRLLAQSQGNLGVVAHGGINRGWLCRLLGRSPDQVMALPQPWGGLTEVRVDGDLLTVERLGVRPSPWPSREEIEALWKKYNTPAPVRAHCEAVALRAGELAGQTGLTLNLELLNAACLLHDLVRDRPGHARAGGERLVREGWPEVGALVSVHHDLPREAGAEAALLFLADKLVQETRPVTLEERFQAKRALCKTPEALNAWEARFRQAREAAERLNLL